MNITRPISSDRVVGKRGFTLVELLVVITIISILISVLVPAAWSALKSARQSAAAESARGIGQLMTQYSLDRGQYPDGPTSTDAFKLLLSTGLSDFGEYLLPAQWRGNQVRRNLAGDQPDLNQCVV